VPGLEPTMIGVAAVLRSANGEGSGLLLHVVRRWLGLDAGSGEWWADWQLLVH
jgi:hypothetical protein